MSAALSQDGWIMDELQKASSEAGVLTESVHDIAANLDPRHNGRNTTCIRLQALKNFLHLLILQIMKHDNGRCNRKRNLQNMMYKHHAKYIHTIMLVHSNKMVDAIPWP